MDVRSTFARSGGIRLFARRLWVSIALLFAAAMVHLPAHAAMVTHIGFEKVFDLDESGYFLPGVSNLEFRSVNFPGGINAQVYAQDVLVNGVWQPGAAIGLALFGGELVGPNDKPGLWSCLPCGMVGFDHNYMAFSFEADDGTHFGWLTFSVPSAGPFVIHDYAYEDRAGAAIRVGQTTSVVAEPATVALVALGLAGVIAPRRRRVSRG